MLPIRTILHPTDFSERSGYAFRLACALARDCGARLLVLHVMPPPLMAYGGGPFPAEPERYEEHLREKLHQLRPAGPEVAVEHLMAQGEAAEEILRIASDMSCDLIVMGTHGRTGMGRLLMGSVAEWVLRAAPCPVLTVRLPFPLDAAQGSGAAPAEELPHKEIKP
jgi:nucleotide-binding universal stress UspA family protein